MASRVCIYRRLGSRVQGRPMIFMVKACALSAVSDGNLMARNCKKRGDSWLRTDRPTAVSDGTCHYIANMGMLLHHGAKELVRIAHLREPG